MFRYLPIYFIFQVIIVVRKMALTAAEKQRRYRERRKKYPEKVAEAKRKDLERYHARKKQKMKEVVRTSNHKAKIAIK